MNLRNYPVPSPRSSILIFRSVLINADAHRQDRPYFWKGRSLSDLFHPLVSPSEWLLDPNITFLNHGSFGAVPRSLIAEQHRLQELMERNPAQFLTFELPTALRAAAQRLADFIGGAGTDYAFVENATAGCNAILASVRLSPGDEILVTDHCYPAVFKAAEHVASQVGAKVIEAKVPFPLMDQAEIFAAITERLGSRTRLVILDHVTSPTAIVFPVWELTELCHKAGARVLIDGAHAPGMLSLDIPSIDADWYVGNCHKWLMAPKGSGFLWASPLRPTEMHPLVISHGYRQGFVEEFDWTGTRDPTAWLTVPAAIDLHLRLGGHSLRERNTLLIRRAASQLAEQWNSDRGSTDALSGSMTTVRLPFHEEGTLQRALTLRALLLKDHRIDVLIIAFAGSLWARISAQAYNGLTDYQRLVDAVKKLKAT
jgi:isopenicillin-N epimerase